MNSGWIWGEGTMWYSDGTVVTGTWEGTEGVEVKSTNKVDPETVIEESNSRLSAFLSDEYLTRALEIME